VVVVANLGSPRSLRRAYRDWVDEQIEEFKDTVSRSELLRLADEVVDELHVNRRGQYQLTEMLLWAAVDRKIFRLLKLPGYRSWSAAQATPAAPEELDGDPLVLSLCVD
jgi:hypothetical protein